MAIRIQCRNTLHSVSISKLHQFAPFFSLMLVLTRTSILFVISLLLRYQLTIRATKCKLFIILFRFFSVCTHAICLLLFCQQNVAHIYDGFHRVRFVFAIFFSLLVIIHGSSIYCKYWCIWHSCITFYRQSVNVSDRFSMNLLYHFRVAFDIFSSENCLLWP